MAEHEATLPIATATLETLPIAEVTPIGTSTTTSPTATEEYDDEILPVATLLCANKTCDNEGIKRCSRCKVAYYCSTGCQKADWKNGHKKICGSGNGNKGSADCQKKQQKPTSQQQQPSSSTDTNATNSTTNEDNTQHQPTDQTTKNNNNNKENNKATNTSTKAAKIIPIQTRRMAQSAAKKLVSALQSNSFPDEHTGTLFGIQVDNDENNSNDTTTKKMENVETINNNMLVYQVWIEIYRHRLHRSSSSSSIKEQTLAIKTFTADIAASLASGKVADLFQELAHHVLLLQSTTKTGGNKYCMEMKRRGFDCIQYSCLG